MLEFLQLYCGDELFAVASDVELVFKHREVVVCDGKAKAGAFAAAGQSAFGEGLLEALNVFQFLSRNVGDCKADCVVSDVNSGAFFAVENSVVDKVRDGLLEELFIRLDNDALFIVIDLQ